MSGWSCDSLTRSRLVSVIFLTICGIDAARGANQTNVTGCQQSVTKTNVLPSLGALLALAGLGNVASQDCSYQNQLEVGKTYYVYNPGYPNTWSGRRSCQWVAQSEYRVKLTCGEFNLPKSNQCAESVLTVNVSDGNSQRYCGNGVFSAISKGNEMTINFDSSYSSRASKFLCLLQAIGEEQDSDTCRCGWKKPTRIVGGVETGVNEYTMMAGLVDVNARDLYCGATIIAPKYVLTAAHCLLDRTIDALGVLVGEHDITKGTDTNATRLHRVERIMMHPQYQQPKTTYDIGIVTVVGTIWYTQEVGPACLPFQHRSDSFVGDYVDILGWGTTEYGGSRSDVLMKTRVSVITNQRCQRTFGDVTRSQICTLTPGHDACQFDSGGPVLWQNPTTMQLVHIGIISFGGICGSTAPGVNTRVGDYIDWITFNTPDAVYCMNE